MSETFVKKIKSKLYIESDSRSVRILEGNYLSYSSSHSLDFEELREYNHGDSVRDIDWRATAKSSSTLVKRREGKKEIPIVFVFDAGKSMQALTDDGLSRGKLGLYTAGVLGVLGLKHGDSFSFIFGDNKTNYVLQNRNTEKMLESYLQQINSYVESTNNNSDISNQLNFALSKIKSHATFVVISNDVYPSEEATALLNKVKVRHNLLWVSVRDANPFVLASNLGENDNIVVDIEEEFGLPDFLFQNTTIRNALQSFEEDRLSDSKKYLNKLNISSTGIASVEEIIGNLSSMLSERKRKIKK